LVISMAKILRFPTPASWFKREQARFLEAFGRVQVDKAEMQAAFAEAMAAARQRRREPEKECPAASKK
jgi:hypothetical protein